jgi:hypothetical protein
MISHGSNWAMSVAPMWIICIANSFEPENVCATKKPSFAVVRNNAAISFRCPAGISKSNVGYLTFFRICQVQVNNEMSQCILI